MFSLQKQRNSMQNNTNNVLLHTLMISLQNKQCKTMQTKNVLFHTLMISLQNNAKRCKQQCLVAAIRRFLCRKVRSVEQVFVIEHPLGSTNCTSYPLTL